MWRQAALLPTAARRTRSARGRRGRRATANDAADSRDLAASRTPLPQTVPSEKGKRQSILARASIRSPSSKVSTWPFSIPSFIATFVIRRYIEDDSIVTVGIRSDEKLSQPQTGLAFVTNDE